jgi:hypothetical protein
MPKINAVLRVLEDTGHVTNQIEAFLAEWAD